MTRADRRSYRDMASWFADYQRSGDREARDRILEAHRDLIEYCVRRFTGRGVPAEDLRQIAALAIIRALDRFDPDRGVEFTTFAVRAAEGELKRYFRDRTWYVRPPRRTQETHLAVRQAIDDLQQRLRREPTIAEIAREISAAEDHVLEAIEAGAARHASSIDLRTSDEIERATTVNDRIARSDPGYAAVEGRVVLDELLDRLPDRERAIIELRFTYNLSQEEIANCVGVSQSYLSRLLRQILLDLREELRDRLDLTDLSDVVSVDE